MQTFENESNGEVERLAVEEIPERPKKSRLRVVDQEPAPPPDMNWAAPTPPEPARDERMIEMFKTIGYVLSARALLLLAVIGAFVLAILAALHETQATLYVFVAWCILTLGPLVSLEWRRRE